LVVLKNTVGFLNGLLTLLLQQHLLNVRQNSADFKYNSRIKG